MAASASSTYPPVLFFTQEWTGQQATWSAGGEGDRPNPEPVALRPNYWLKTSRERKPGLGYLQEARWKVKVRVPKGQLADLPLEQFSTPEQVQKMAQGYESAEWEAARMVEHEFVEPDSAVDNRRKRALDAARKIVCVGEGGVAWKVVEEGKEEREEKEEEKQQQEKEDDGWAAQEKNENGWLTETGHGSSSRPCWVKCQSGATTSATARTARPPSSMLPDSKSTNTMGPSQPNGQIFDARQPKKRTHMSRKQVVGTLERRFDKGMKTLCREFNSIGTEVNYRQLAAHYDDVVSVGAALSSASWPEQTDRAELVNNLEKGRRLETLWTSSSTGLLSFWQSAMRRTQCYGSGYFGADFGQSGVRIAKMTAQFGVEGKKRGWPHRGVEEQQELRNKRTQKRKVEDQFYICNLPADIKRVHSPGFCGVLCNHPKHSDVLDVRMNIFSFVESMKGISVEYWHVLTPKSKRNFEADIGTIPTFLQPGGKTVTTVALGKYAQGNPEPVALRPNYWLETSRERKPGLGSLRESRWKVKVRVSKDQLAAIQHSRT
ncbi:hypothetical protein niasHS_014349 [Heterodera schachtii]|uniref:Uncharacterized protein n=1 Tax=Heterodera schachtii TaxID=97005 RepID=A0ABD2I479_HETSC